MNRCWKIALRVLLAFVILIGLFYLEEDLRGARVWKKTQEELKAKHEPLTIAEITPAPIPDDQNMAAAPIFREIYELPKERELEARIHTLDISHKGPSGTVHINMTGYDIGAPY